jgi:hypothetical protein
VRYFGLDLEVFVEKTVEMLGRSCFEGHKHLGQIYFEIRSELERIGPAALRDCESFASIEMPACVTIIDDGAFEGCSQLESCLIARDSSLVRIGGRAFAKCPSLRSFYFPSQVNDIGSKCFSESIYLYRLTFRSSESLTRVIGDRPLEDALEEFGVSVNTSLFGINLEEGGSESNFPGWAYDSGDEQLQLSLV